MRREEIVPKGLPFIRPVTASVGPRILPAALVFLVILICGAIGLIPLLARLPDRYAFWKSDEGIAIAEILLAVLLTAGLLPALILWFSTGRITVDSAGMRWKVRGERGEIRWDRPFTVRRWQSVLTATVYGDSGPGYEQRFPVVVYEVSQGDTSITFYRGAGWDEVRGLPSGELRGVMLFLRARRLTDAIEAVWRET